MLKQGNLSFSSSLSAEVHRAKRPSLGWKLRNLRHTIKGDFKWWVARRLNIATFYGHLAARIDRADGTVEMYDHLSSRVVTTAFVNALAASLVSAAATPLIDGFDWHASGIGTTAEAVGDTTLVNTTGAPARVSGTPSNPSANVYQTVATTAYTSTLAITEHGVFSASTAGTLMDRSVFAALNVNSGDSVTWTYQLTSNAGG